MLLPENGKVWYKCKKKKKIWSELTTRRMHNYLIPMNRMASSFQNLVHVVCVNTKSINFVAGEEYIDLVSGILETVALAWRMKKCKSNS